MSRRGLLRGARRQMKEGDRVFWQSDDEAVWRPAFDLSVKASNLIARIGPRYWDHMDQKWAKSGDPLSFAANRPDGSLDDNFEIDQSTGRIGWLQMPCSDDTVAMVSPIRDKYLGLVGWKSDHCNETCEHKSQMSAAVCAATTFLRKLAEAGKT